MTDTSPNKSFTGSCCCGAISYETKAESVKPVWFCHCRQCRYMTGHFMAASQVPLDKIQISGEPKWYYVSENSRHGFCPECGSQIFWRNDTNDFMSISAGSMHHSDLPNKGHIFTAEKGDYYDIPTDEVQCKTWTNN